MSVLIATATITFPVGCSESGSGGLTPGNLYRNFARVSARTSTSASAGAIGADLDVEMNEVGREITGALNRHAFT